MIAGVSGEVEERTVILLLRCGIVYFSRCTRPAVHTWLCSSHLCSQSSSSRSLDLAPSLHRTRREHRCSKVSLSIIRPALPTMRADGALTCLTACVPSLDSSD